MDRPALDPRAVVRSASAPVPPSNPAATVGCASTAAARAWRCHACGALLGMEHDGELHLKYKEIQHWIRGRCRHACRRCGAMNTRLTPDARAAPVSRGDTR